MDEEYILNRNESLIKNLQEVSDIVLLTLVIKKDGYTLRTALKTSLLKYSYYNKDVINYFKILLSRSELELEQGFFDIANFIEVIV